MAALDLIPRQDATSPCPSGNGTEIGDTQSFQVLCDTQIGGNGVGGGTAASLDECAEMCTSHQNPRCDAAVYRTDNQCEFIAGVQITWAEAGVVSAMGLLPDKAPETDCTALGDGSTQRARGKSMKLHCGLAYEGDDLNKLYQETFEGCRSTCAAHAECVGVSYEASQSQGFQNCYLKLKGSKLASRQGFDSASRGKHDELVSASEDDEAASAATTMTVAATATVSMGASDNALAGTDGGGPSTTMIASIVGAVIGSLFALSLMLGILVYRNRRSRRRRIQQNARAADKAPELDEAGINVSTTIDQRDFYKTPSVTTNATSDRTARGEQDPNPLGQNRVGSALMDYLRSIGRGK